MDKKKEKDIGTTERVARKLICWDYKTKRNINKMCDAYKQHLFHGKALHIFLLHMPLWILFVVFVSLTTKVSETELPIYCHVLWFCLMFLLMGFSVIGTVFAFFHAEAYLSDVKAEMKLEKEC